jgi:hypothetical protein
MVPFLHKHENKTTRQLILLGSIFLGMRQTFQPVFYKFMAYYYNNAIDWGKEVVVNTKSGFGDNIQVFDIERGKSNKILKLPWQTDTSIGKKSPNHIIDDFMTDSSVSI